MNHDSYSKNSPNSVAIFNSDHPNVELTSESRVRGWYYRNMYLLFLKWPATTYPTLWGAALTS
jgi:hypothetical protein